MICVLLLSFSSSPSPAPSSYLLISKVTYSLPPGWICTRWNLMSCLRILSSPAGFMYTCTTSSPATFPISFMRHYLPLGLLYNCEREGRGEGGQREGRDEDTLNDHCILCRGVVLVGDGVIDVSSVPRQLELSVRETIAERPDWCTSVILVCSTCLCNVTTSPPLIVSPASTRPLASLSPPSRLPLASLSPRYCTWWQRHVHVGHVDLCGVVCVVYCVWQLASGVVVSKYRTRNCKSTYLKY